MQKKIMEVFILSVLASIIASFIFIFSLLLFFKPNFEIVHVIAKSDSPFDNVSDVCYAFKIINKSYFGAYDIEARVNYYNLRQGANGIINKVFKKIELKTHRVNFIPGYKKSKNYGDNCVQFFTYEDLESSLNNDTNVQFQITARHSLTGLNNIFTYNFIAKNSIKEGIFKEGNFNEVIN